MYKFKIKPFVKEETLNKYGNIMVEIEEQINKRLEKYDNFKCIDFCDVGANGIQIRGHHNQINNYTFIEQTVKYDFSNYLEAIEKFVNKWKESDTKENVKIYKEFISFGEKYGWD